MVNFYKKLLGSCANSLPSINLTLVRNNNTLNMEARRSLITTITADEIDITLGQIDDSKAPSVDGFNAHFFKKAWSVIKNDIYQGVQEFFHKAYMHMPMNITLLTLIPKFGQPLFAKDFRPIACCTMLYKIIAKVLTNRLGQVIQEVVSPSQAGFIPGRFIADNILLAT